MQSKYLFGIFVIIAPVILGLKNDSMFMGLDYFGANFVNFVCLLTCRFDHSILEYVKISSNRSIAIFQVSITTLDESRLSPCLNQPLTSVGVMLDTSCPGYKEIMSCAAAEMLLDRAHKWLLIEEESRNINTTDNFSRNYNTTATFHKEEFEIVEFLEGIDTNLNAEIIIAKQKAGWFRLLEVFNFGKTKGGKFIVHELGTWSSMTGLQIEKRYKYYRHWDFQNLTLRMIVVMSVPQEGFDEQMLVGNVAGPGVNVVTQVGSTILYEIARIHNFRYNYTITDQWIGPFQRNATRVVSNSLYFREQDISPVLRFFRANINYLDILHPQLTSIETRYYYRILSYGPGRFENQFLAPLSPTAWWCVVAMSVACGVVLLAAAVLEQHPSSGQYAFFSVFATFCQQFFEDVDAMRVTKPSTAGKLTILVTGIFCVLIYNYYTSSVVSWLLNGPPPSINSLWELLESPLRLAYEEVGYTKTWIELPDYNYNKRNVKVELEMRRRKVWNKKKGEPLMVPLSEGIELIRGGEYAYHMEVNTANMLIALNFDQEELCELGSLQSMEPTSLYAVVQKDSPYKEFFIWSLARFAERGLIRCIENRLLSSSLECEGSSPRALALGGAAPAFILLGIGYVAGFCIMMMERIIYRRKKTFLNFSS